MYIINEMFYRKKGMQSISLYILLFFFTLKLSSQNKPILPTAQIQGGFIENKGQFKDEEQHMRSDVLFYTRCNSQGVFFKKDGIMYSLSKREKHSDDNPKSRNNNTACYRMDMNFQNINPTVTFEKNKILPQQLNYYVGKDEAINNVKQYAELVYKNIYPNIDVAFTNEKNGLKYDIVIFPGGNPSDISIKYTGATNLSLDNGILKIETALGTIEEFIPRIYQNINGKSTTVDGQYRITNQEVSFVIGHYNPNYTLVIDPFITLFGGNQMDVAGDIAVDSLSNTIVMIGSTLSMNLPVTPGVFQTSKSSTADWDACVAKFDVNGSFQWATFYGGVVDDDFGNGVAVDYNGDIICVGTARSTDFPVTPGATQTLHAGTGADDIYVFKLTSAGAQVWSTYYGGTGNESPNCVQVFPNNDIVFAGSSTSVDYPTTAGAYQTNRVAGNDVVISKFNSAGVPIWSTYYGGSSAEDAASVAINKNNELIVSGYTRSADFPITPGVFQTSLNNLSDAFIIKLDNGGNPLWGTFIGGSDNDQSYGVDTDNNNNIVACGTTLSADFPVTPGAHQTNYGGTGPNTHGDAFVIKLDDTGNRVWSSYIGGTNDEEGYGVFIDASDNIYIALDTYGGDLAATACAYQTMKPGDEDGFFFKMDSGGKIACASYLGGPGHDEVCFDYIGGSKAILEYDGSIFIAGSGGFPNFPATPGAFQTAHGGTFYDLFLAEFCATGCGLNSPIYAVQLSANDSSVCVGDTISLSDLSVLCDTIGATWSWTFYGGTPSSSTNRNPQEIVYNTAGTYDIRLIVTTACGVDSIIKNNYITVNSLPTLMVSGSLSLCEGSATAVTAAGASQYTWSPATGISSTTGAVVSISSASNITFTLTGVDANGCMDTTSVTFSVVPTPTLTVSQPDTICNGSSLTLTASASGGTSPAYAWSPQSGLSSSTGVSVLATPTLSTTYTVVVTNGGNCSDTSFINVIVDSVPDITVTGVTTICSGDSSFLTATGAATYHWLPATGISSTTGSGVFVFPVSPVSYTVTGYAINGCFDTAIVNIFINAVPVANAGPDDTICVGQIATLNASGGAAYSWSTGSSGAVINVSPPVSASYSVTVFNGSCFDVDSVKVEVVPAPVADAGNNTFVQSGSSITLSGSGGGSYLWQPSTGLSCVTCQNPQASPTASTSYTLIVTDAQGCTSVDSVYVEIICSGFFVPNAFSPNADGQNDVFYVKANNCVKTFLFIIYDRWGEKVFETTDPTKGWDGTYKGEAINSAVFVYSLDAVTINDEVISKKGNITLIR